MEYEKLCFVYEELEKNNSRLKKTEILSHFLSLIKKQADREIFYLLQGRTWPDYKEEEFGVSDQITIKAISKTSGVSSEEVIKKFKKLGDLGIVASEFLSNKKQHTLFNHKLTTEKVIGNLKKLPELKGKGTVDKKMSLISELLTSASGLEAKYIVRTLLNQLRIGVASGTLRDAVVWNCFDKEDKEAYVLVQESYDKVNDWAEVFRRALKGKEELEKTELNIGQPIKVMLFPKENTIEEGFERVGRPCLIDYKYDGFRMLINKDETGNVKIFTRRLDEVTKQFPEVVEYVKKYVSAKSFMLDSEAVGYDPKTKTYLSFQNISQRIKRKYDIEKMAKNLPVEINVFDILYFEGKSVISEPYQKRREIIERIVNSQKLKIRTSESIITSDNEEAENFYKRALKAGEEGVMMKSLTSPYKPGARVGHAVKIKPEGKEFDLVIIGAEYGKGKRTGWLSSFDIACRHNDGFLGVGKVGTGIKEKQELGVSFEELTKLLNPLIISEKDNHIKVKPKIVVEIAYQEIQKSPSYESGFALRFPRLIRLRPDKKPDSIYTLEDIKQEYEKLKR